MAARRHDELEPDPTGLAGWLAWLYRDHREALCAWLRRKYGPGPPEPEDVVQQAFVRLSRLDPGAAEAVTHPKSFLYQTAQNILIDEKRREALRARHAQEALATGDAGEGFDPATETVLVMRGDLDLIERALRRMPERRRQCFLLHRLEGLSCAEIGRRLGMSAPGARKHVEKALGEIEAAVARGGGR